MISTPERYAEYRAFSREGFPAITALVSLVRPELEPLRHSHRREFDAAKQFVGWAVGRIMRDHGHKTVGRSRIPVAVYRRRDLEREAGDLPIVNNSAVATAPTATSRQATRLSGRICRSRRRRPKRQRDHEIGQPNQRLGTRENSLDQCRARRGRR